MSKERRHELLTAALAHHQAGEFEEAERLYAEVLVADANDPDALHLLGLAKLQTGQPRLALELIGQAVTLRPSSTLFRLNQAAVFETLGELAQAVDCCQAVLALEPNIAATHLKLGILLEQQGKLDEAVVAFEAAARLDGSSAEAHARLGTALLGLRRLDEAAAHLRRAVALQHDFATAHANLATVYQEQGRTEAALEHHHMALTGRPNDAELNFNLGNALLAARRLEEAARSYTRAIEVRPDYAEAHMNLGKTWSQLAEWDRALSSYRAAVAAKPDYPEAHFGLATQLLGRGDYREGWAEFEWRWQCAEMAAQARHTNIPRWDGRPLSGASILIHAEQGFGDTIQFVRLTEQVNARGGNVVLECFAELARLLRESRSAPRVVSRGQAVPEVDWQIPLMSLPHALDVTEETIPSQVPYLTANQQPAHDWGARLKGASGLRVGLVWRARPGDSSDERSLSIEDLLPLAEVPGVTFISLQKDAAPPDDLSAIDLGALIDDFADTAAILSQLDLLISVDTATAHLAGAMAKPVWLLLPTTAEWRWLRQRDDSPWYPTMRLFRQTRPDDWSEVIERLVVSLATRAA